MRRASSLLLDEGRSDDCVAPRLTMTGSGVVLHFRGIRGWLVRLFGLFHRKRRERKFAEELESHLALHIEDTRRCGSSGGGFP